jgi:hypothetical protein
MLRLGSGGKSCVEKCDVRLGITVDPILYYSRVTEPRSSQRAFSSLLTSRLFALDVSLFQDSCTKRRALGKLSIMEMDSARPPSALQIFLIIF